VARLVWVEAYYHEEHEEHEAWVELFLAAKRIKKEQKWEAGRNANGSNLADLGLGS